MYLTIGKNTVIRDDEIIGIFDLDNCSQSFLTREFLSAAEKAGRVHWRKEYIKCKQNGETHVGNKRTDPESNGRI